jgi:SecD/SecF fusion protein
MAKRLPFIIHHSSFTIHHSGKSAMKELRWKIIWCLSPVVLGLLIIGIALYNYNNPIAPIKFGEKGIIKFKLGVDLVGGTILVYEIDPDKKPENYNKEQLISALKRRLDPADLYNITIRPLSDTRVEIILPTGGRHVLAAQEQAWNDLLDAVVEEWGDKGVKKENLTSRRGDLADLSVKIRDVDKSIPSKDIDDLFKKKYGDVLERQLTGDDVEKIKDLIQRVGSLEFRILANRNDDKEAIDAAKVYFDAAALQWRSILDAAKAKYPEINKPGAEGDSTPVADIACGDEAGLKKLIKNRRPKSEDRDVDRWFVDNVKPVNQLKDFMNRADRGFTPPSPLGGDGKRFRIKLNDGEHQISYSWVELGKQELHSLQLNNDAVEEAIADAIDSKRVQNKEEAERDPRVMRARAMQATARKARAEGKIFDTYSSEGRGIEEPIMGGQTYRVQLFSREITNRSRLTDKDKKDGKKYEYFFLTRDPEPGKAVTGEFLTGAKEEADRSGSMAVGFAFNSRGGALFYELTNANAPPSDDKESRRFLAVVLDGLIMSAPGLNSAIRDRGIIEGKFTKAEIESLVNILRSGALPATLKPQPVSENTMGATLGEDTIRSGTFSLAVAFGAVLLFMLIYYRFAGFVACVALMANLILTIGFMVAVSATFTLPGLAGLVLMLAMAVDANILIYERLREERERGASLAQALRNGYDRAFPTIIDTHLSSIFTAVVLYIVGNDQLKGFGISLTVGLLISLFTSLVMTRLIFRFWEINGWLKKLSMAKLLSKTRINFMGIRKPVFIATVVTAFLGLAIFLARGKSSLNMDFVGGTVYSGKLTKFQSIDDLRKDLENEDRQKELLALATDPEPREGRTWKLTYKESVDGVKERIIRMTEDLSADEMRRRAEVLPEPSLELIFQSDSESSEGNTSKLFTVRTTEKSADLVAASVSRLLGGKLETTRLDDYTIQSVILSCPKPMTVEQARLILVPALVEAKLLTGVSAKDVDAMKALKSVPVTGGALALLRAGDKGLITGKEVGPQKDTFKTLALSFKDLGKDNDRVNGEKLLETLLKLKQFDVQVSEAHLNLSDFAYPAQVKGILDARFKDVLSQEVPLAALEGAKEQEGGFREMVLGPLPAPVDGERFLDLMKSFSTELASRPLPVRLENFDSALAADMQQRALYAIIASWAAILLYLWFRFGNWTFGLAAVLCLIHDVCMTLGVIALAHYLHGSFFASMLGLRDFKIDLPAVAALLTLIGFSVNDTIVVFDRIREVRGKNPQLTPEMINDSVNQTLSRTVLTSTTAWLVVLVLYLWGGEGVHLFAFVMVIGVIVGTMSSIFVASPLLLYLGEGASPTTAPQRAQAEKPATAQS